MRNVIGILALSLCLTAAAAQRTVRIGEQDTCDLTGVTEDRKNGIRFDCSKWPADVKVLKATLRFWVPATNPFAPLSKKWDFSRWDEEGFDGFKVYRGTAADEASLLDTQFPFTSDGYWLFEFDVTQAAQDWVKDPSQNEGLTANFTFPTQERPEIMRHQTEWPAWQKPYLQVTLETENIDRPKQPGELKAEYRHGQVFLTWKKLPHSGAFFDSTYRVYRHTQPITAQNLAQAQLLGEAHRLSQMNVRRTWSAVGGVYGPWREYAKRLETQGKLEPRQKGENETVFLKRLAKAIGHFNFVLDETWAQQHPDGILERAHKSEAQETHRDLRIYDGPGLADDRGLFVHTVEKDGPAYYAVTHVLEGNENRDAFSAGNALSKPVEAQIAVPRPILQAVVNGASRYGDATQVREYVYFGGPGGKAPMHSEASTPFCFVALVPPKLIKTHEGQLTRAAKKNETPWLVSIAKLAGYAVHYWDGSAGATLNTDSGYVPATAQAPFPPTNCWNMGHWDEFGRYFYGSKTPPEKAEGNFGGVAFGGSYGYAENIDTGRDPRQATVYPYFENRRRFEMAFAIREFGYDPAHTALMGQSSDILFGIHHADLVGWVSAAQEMPWAAPKAEGRYRTLVGLKKWKLKNEHGVEVWNWNDPIWYSRQFPKQEWPFISHCWADNYDGTNWWEECNYPQFYLDLATEKRATHLWWCDIGDAPQGGGFANAANHAVAALSNVTVSHELPSDWKDRPRGTLNGFVVWNSPADPWEQLPREKPAHSPELVDTPERFEMAFRIWEHGRILNGQSVPPLPGRIFCGAADITPRRLQAFKTVAGASYVWKNVKCSNGRLLQAGVVKADKLGRISVPGFLVDRDLCGNKLILEPGTQAPTVDEGQTVAFTYYRNLTDLRTRKNAQQAELPYAEYVKLAGNPVMTHVARNEREFKRAEFQNQRGDGFSMWGNGQDDYFQFDEAGRYRIEVRIKDAFKQNGAWPLLLLRVDNEPQGEQRIDSVAEAIYCWWVDLAKGRHLIDLPMTNHVFNEPVPRTGKKDRGFDLQGVRFVKLPKMPEAAGAPFQVRIGTRSVTTGVGVPVQLQAQVLDEWGRQSGSQPGWQTEGATIAPDGTFSAAKAGTYRVTARAGGQSDTVEVVVEGDAFVDDFDDECHDGWATIRLAEPDARSTGSWVVHRINSIVGLLRPANSQSRTDPHLLVFEGGMGWSDYHATVDRMPGWMGMAEGAVQGLVFRYADARNHYRFDLVHDAKAKSYTARLLKMAEGKESVLAEKAVEVSPQEIDPSRHRSFQHFSDQWKETVAQKKLSYIQFGVEVLGDKIVAKLNGQEVLSAQDAEYRIGTVGLYSEGGALFDNVTVKPVK